MNQHLAFDFSVDRENNTIIVKREFDAGISLVWDAYTQKEILDEWWAPKPWKSVTKSMNFVNGGTRIYAMVGPNGEEHWAFGNFDNIHKEKGFTVHDGFCDPDGNIMNDLPRSKWELTFSEIGERTLVEIIIQYEQLSQLEAILQMGFKEGFAMALDNLDALLPSLK